MNIIADITLAEVQHWIPMITALLVVAFDWGILYAKIKTFVTKEEVDKIVDKKLIGHCTNVIPIKNIELKVQSLENWKQEHTEWGNKVDAKTHLDLQELRYNLKAVCEALGVKYQNGEK